MIYEYLNLYSTPELFVIQPHNGNDILVIDRQSYDISITSDAASVTAGLGPPAPIYGLWGVLPLLSGPHLVVVKSRAPAGSLLGHAVWRVVDTELLPYSRSMLHLTYQEAGDNAAYLQMAADALRTPGYYFSCTLDLTRCAQRAAAVGPEAEAAGLSLFERADERFVWNYHPLAELVRQSAGSQPGVGRFALPIVHGFVCIQTVACLGRQLEYALISRRSRHRAGVRYYARGADDYGCAANYVETEQLVLAQGHRFSFVLTRGSVPLSWSQFPNLLYKPTPVLSQDWGRQQAVFVAHFNDQVYTQGYGQQVVVNLLDGSGKERELCSQLSRMCSQPEVPQRLGLRYEHFDFHRECGRLRWDRLALLLERTEPDFDAMGYFHAGADGTALRTQRSVFRVNCIDCLDRTNVAQCLFARRALLRHLADLGWIPAAQRGVHLLATEAGLAQLEAAVKAAWADNADALSQQYAGTGALKADFTRLGRRTRYGLLLDGYYSAVRYARNNFSDGWRQDCVDLLLGNYRPERGGGPSPLAGGRDWKVWLLPSVLLFGLAMLLMGSLLPPEHWTEHMLFSLFWGTFVVLAVFGILYYGEDFVDRPRLAMRVGRQRRA